MRNEHLVIFAGIVVGAIGFLPEIYAVIRAFRFHLLTIGLLAVMAGYVFLNRQPETTAVTDTN